MVDIAIFNSRKKNTTPSIVACLVIYCTSLPSCSLSDTTRWILRSCERNVEEDRRAARRSPNTGSGRSRRISPRLSRLRLWNYNPARGWNRAQSISPAGVDPWRGEATEESATRAIANFLVRKRYTRINYYRTHISLA